MSCPMCQILSLQLCISSYGYIYFLVDIGFIKQLYFSNTGDCDPTTVLEKHCSSVCGFVCVHYYISTVVYLRFGSVGVAGVGGG